VTGDQLGHLEHRDRLLTAKDGLQFVVSVDLGLGLFVLQTILLDVSPELLGELCARKRSGANDSGESRVGRDRFHECGVRFAS